MKALQYAVLAGLLASGVVVAETKDTYTLHDKWQNRGLTGKAVNNIQHDNLIAVAKESKWVLLPTSTSGYFNICLPDYNNLCLYSYNKSNGMPELKTGYIKYLSESASRWKFEEKNFNGKSYFKIKNLYNQAINWDKEKPSVNWDANAVSNLDSKYFKKEKVVKPSDQVVTFVDSTLDFKAKKYQRTYHYLTVPNNIDYDVQLAVWLTGDFDNGNEYASIYVEGDQITTFDNNKGGTDHLVRGGQGCGVQSRAHMATIPAEKIRQYAADGKVQITVANGSRVNNSNSDSDKICSGKHKVALSYFEEAENGGGNIGYGSPVSDGTWYLTRSYDLGTHQCYSSFYNTSATALSPICDRYALDIAPPSNDTVPYNERTAIAVEGGQVVSILNNNIYQGNTVVVRHNNNVYSRYSHLNSVIVPLNANIQRGDHIGVIGSTGNSTGRHLHFVMYEINGNTVSPYKPEPLGGLNDFPSGSYNGNPVLISNQGILSCSSNCLDIE